ncbi:MAG: DUF1775 domain-containing protein [Pseudomonadota bacterium]
MIKRTTLVCAAATMLVAVPQAAFAHATLEVVTAPANSTYKAVLRVPHGCDGEATNTLTVTLPEGFIAVKPMPKAGWDLEVESGPYENTYTLHGKEVSAGPRVIRWTGGELADAHYDEFIFRGRLADLAPGTVLPIPTVQTCANGEVAWREIAAAGQDPHDLARPAPTLTIADAGGHGHGHGHAHGAAHSHGAKAEHGTAMAGNIVITGAWTREPPPGAAVGGGYMEVTNTGTEPDRLMGGSVPFAEHFEVHEMAVTDGMMRMRALEDGLLIAPGETVALQPGGFHLMFMGIQDAPEEGDAVAVTLEFEKAGSVMVMMPVQAMGAQDGPGSHGHGRDGKHSQ